MMDQRWKMERTMNSKVLNAIFATMERDILYLISMCAAAKDAWKFLEKTIGLSISLYVINTTFGGWKVYSLLQNKREFHIQETRGQQLCIEKGNASRFGMQ